METCVDSINRNQPEHNRENLIGKAAGKKIKELGEKASTCFFCTSIASGRPIQVRPMSIQRIDDDGVCWFLSAKDSDKNQELLADAKMQLLFQGSAHSDFVSLYGSAEITTDQNMIHGLWEPIVKTWFTEGETDPRITVIKFTPEEGYYWDTKHGNIVAFAKMAIGAAIGQTLDDSIEGTLKA